MTNREQAFFDANYSIFQSTNEYTVVEDGKVTIDQLLNIPFEYGQYIHYYNSSVSTENNYGVYVVILDGKTFIFNRDIAFINSHGIGLQVSTNEVVFKHINRLGGYSHYHYLELVIEEFWNEVFGRSLKETGCGGIITAHGDKCRQYNDAWSDAGINEYRGALLYMLTYTNLMDRPKHDSCQWVIDNYSKYYPVIVEIEKSIGINNE